MLISCGHSWHGAECMHKTHGQTPLQLGLLHWEAHTVVQWQRPMLQQMQILMKQICEAQSAKSLWAMTHHCDSVASLLKRPVWPLQPHVDQQMARQLVHSRIHNSDRHGCKLGSQKGLATVGAHNLDWSRWWFIFLPLTLYGHEWSISRVVGVKFWVTSLQTPNTQEQSFIPIEQALAILKDR